MKCPRCGEETDWGKTCERCGEALPSEKDVEVEYKEFRVTELLDIRMAKKGTGTGQEGEKSETLSGRHAKPLKNDSGTTPEPAKKSFFIVMMVVIIIILSAIAAFRLFRFSSGF